MHLTDILTELAIIAASFIAAAAIVETLKIEKKARASRIFAYAMLLMAIPKLGLAILISTAEPELHWTSVSPGWIALSTLVQTMAAFTTAKITAGKNRK